MKIPKETNFQLPDQQFWTGEMKSKGTIQILMKNRNYVTGAFGSFFHSFPFPGIKRSASFAVLACASSVFVLIICNLGLYKENNFLNPLLN